MTATVLHAGRDLDLEAWTARLPGLGLAELDARAALQTRVDRKYVLRVDQVTAALAHRGLDLRVLDIDGRRTFAYESVYFDTPDLLGYRMAATRRRRRFKVRSRAYLDSGLCRLEVKTRGPRGTTVKTRASHPFDLRHDLRPGLGFVDDAFAEHAVPAHASELIAVLHGGYHRTTLLVADTDSRLTIDTGLTWRCSGGRARADFLAVVETKSRNGAGPVDRALWAAGIRPTRISKYATGLAAIRPELPDVPWRRTLRRHFDLP